MLDWCQCECYREPAFSNKPYQLAYRLPLATSKVYKLSRYYTRNLSSHDPDSFYGVSGCFDTNWRTELEIYISIKAMRTCVRERVGTSVS